MWGVGICVGIVLNEQILAVERSWGWGTLTRKVPGSNRRCGVGEERLEECMKYCMKIRLWSLWSSHARRDNLSSPKFPRVASGCLVWAPGNSQFPTPAPQKNWGQYRLPVPAPSNRDLQKRWGPPAAWSLWVVRETNEMTHPSGRTALSSQVRWVGVLRSSGLGSTRAAYRDLFQADSEEHPPLTPL